MERIPFNKHTSYYNIDNRDKELEDLKSLIFGFIGSFFASLVIWYFLERDNGNV